MSVTRMLIVGLVKIAKREVVELENVRTEIVLKARSAVMTLMVAVNAAIIMIVPKDKSARTVRVKTHHYSMNVIAMTIAERVRIAKKAPAVCVNVRTEIALMDRSVVPTLMAAASAAMIMTALETKSARTASARIHR